MFVSDIMISENLKSKISHEITLKPETKLLVSIKYNEMCNNFQLIYIYRQVKKKKQSKASKVNVQI